MRASERSRRPGLSHLHTRGPTSALREEGGCRMNAHALTGGHWERRPGGIRVWVPDQPLSPAAQWATDALTTILHTLSATVVTHVTGHPCPDCGCLLRDDRELCPACVIPWCRAQETRGWRLAFERANRRGDGDGLVAEARKRVAA